MIHFKFWHLYNKDVILATKLLNSFNAIPYQKQFEALLLAWLRWAISEGKLDQMFRTINANQQMFIQYCRVNCLLQHIRNSWYAICQSWPITPYMTVTLSLPSMAQRSTSTFNYLRTHTHTNNKNAGKVAGIRSDITTDFFF